MRGKALFTVGQGALLPTPTDERGSSLMNELKVGDRVLVNIHRARNPEHNALAHLVFDRIAAAIGRPMEVIKLWVKWETGWVDVVRLPNGKHIANPRSVSFESMTQDEFQAFWNDAWPIIGEKILPNIPEQAFQEIRDIVAGRPL